MTNSILVFIHEDISITIRYIGVTLYIDICQPIL